ncbi:MAG: biotin--[acetyl-CoA-carboxylase] ligase [Acidimicrobiia bacterium]
MATHYDIVRCAEVASTQDVANERFSSTGETTLVVAARQVDGRGRQGRAWLEPDRGMFASLAFESRWSPDDLTLIPLSAAVSVADAIEASTGTTVDLKWPNDLFTGGMKIGGILVEASGSRVTVGVGVNLWWDRPPEFATAVFSSDPGDPVAEQLAVAWTGHLLGVMAGPATGWPRDRYVERCVTLGSNVTWATGSGRATGIGVDGSLAVETPNGTVEVRQGDVHLSGSG